MFQKTSFINFKIESKLRFRLSHVEQNLFTLPEHLGFWWGSCCLVFSIISCVMCSYVRLFVYFFRHSVFKLLSSYEFECRSDIFRHSFMKSSTYRICFFLCTGWSYGFLTTAKYSTLIVHDTAESKQMLRTHYVYKVLFSYFTSLSNSYLKLTVVLLYDR